MSSRLIFQRTEENGQVVELYGRDEGDPEIYFDGIWGSVTGGQIAKINLYTVAPNEPADGPQRREVAARLVMTVTTVFELRNFMNGLCEKLIESGAVEFENTEDDQKPKRKTKKKKT